MQARRTRRRRTKSAVWRFVIPDIHACAVARARKFGAAAVGWSEIAGKVFVTLALACAPVAVPAQDAAPASSIDVRIDWTRLGIPHIQADDERSLGYGIGYAYAQDNLCLLAEEVVTSSGERARFFGRTGASSSGLDNVASDVYFRWVNTPPRVAAFLQAQPPAVHRLLTGYADGVNRYLRDTARDALHDEPADTQALPCRDEPWVRPLRTEDVARLIRRLLLEGGLGQFSAALVDAVPPGRRAARSMRRPAAPATLRQFASTHGSNAIAIGGLRTENGRGRLLANPHFPWSGALRFYQMHLTIPGRLDVMGAALPGFPLINIGFNRNLAWTHTVDTSLHFTLHRLQLDPKDPTRYIVDGLSRPLKTTALTVEVRENDGGLSREQHTVYESDFGVLVASQDFLVWDRTSAYALQDPNLDNTRVVEQWYALNRAADLGTFRGAIERLQGIPWTNTLAVDERGRALYLNVSVVPNVTAAALSSCADEALQSEGLPALDGSRAECGWQPDPLAAQPGIVGSARMPALQRDDYVQNANDSAWLSNPAAPLTGFPSIVSAENQPLGLRTRFALVRLGERGDEPLSEKFLQDLVTDNRVFLADLVLDDLLEFCRSRRHDEHVIVACDAMAAWDRAATPSSGLGLLYFRAFASAFANWDTGWKVPFDPNEPILTPRGIDWTRRTVARRLERSLRRAAQEVEALGLPKDAIWGSLQFARRGEKTIAIPGAPGQLGVYNAIDSEPAESRGFEPVRGSSYIQLVSFDKQGPIARGVLTYSQSTRAGSPHSHDQTELFSRNEWPLLPFTAEQIANDPPVRQVRLRE